MSNSRPNVTSARSLAVVAFISMVLAIAMSSSAMADTSVLSPSLASWDFGNVDIHGSSATQDFAISNASAGAVTVSSVTIIGPGGAAFQVTSTGCPGAVLGTGDTCDIQTAFAPATAGAKSATLEITDDSGTLDVPLSGTGITGTLTANPSPLNFTPQPWFYGGQQQSMSLQDSGDAGIVTQSAQITGPDAARFYLAWGQNCVSQQYGPGGNCTFGVGFNPPNGPGTFHAQLELTTDSASSPLVIPLNATALSGPNAVISPPQTDFGNVEVGHSASKTVTVANTGDFPMQVQGLLMITGTPSDIPISADHCSNQTVNQGDSCQFTVTYRPSAARELNAAVVLITNGPGAPTPTGFTGDGVPGLNGAVTISGDPSAGSTLTCHPVGFPGGTDFAYRWLRNGHLMAGELTRRLTLPDADIGARMSCRVIAANAIATRTATSRGTAKIAPMTLTDLPGAFSDQGTCRVVQANRVVRLGPDRVVTSFGSPSTPWAPLTFTSGVPVKARIDGRLVGAGKVIVVSPATLDGFPNGRHSLSINRTGAAVQTPIVLGACALAGRLTGGPGQPASLSASSRHPISALTFQLPPQLPLAAARGWRLGWVTITSAGHPIRAFDLVGPRTLSNAVAVAVTAHTVSVTHLPPRTGVVTVTFRAGVVSGRAGTVHLTARLRGSPASVRARTPATWLP